MALLMVICVKKGVKIQTESPSSHPPFVGPSGRVTKPTVMFVVARLTTCTGYFYGINRTEAYPDAVAEQRA